MHLTYGTFTGQHLHQPNGFFSCFDHHALPRKRWQAMMFDPQKPEQTNKQRTRSRDHCCSMAGLARGLPLRAGTANPASRKLRLEPEAALPFPPSPPDPPERPACVLQHASALA